MTTLPYDLPLPQILVNWGRELDDLGRGDEERTAELFLLMRAVGTTANHLGGFAAMQKLHDEAEQLVGQDNSVGKYLNQAWDCVGSWMR